MPRPLRVLLVCALAAAAAAQRSSRLSSRTVTFWGHDACPPAAGATLLYNGTAHHAPVYDGGVANMLCIPFSPSADTFGIDLSPGTDTVALSISPSIYNNAGRTALTTLEAMHNRGIYCAVCNVPNQEMWTNWGDTDCPKPYQTVDTGYMISTYWTHSRRMAICLSDQGLPGPIPPTQTSHQMLYAVEYSRGTEFNGYINDYEIRCAVCKAPEYLSNAGSIFAHWGSLTCPAGSVSVSPERPMMADYYTSSGSPPEYFCMASKPSLEGIVPGQQDTSAIHPVEFQTTASPLTGFPSLHNYEAGCSICRSSNMYSTFMPGRADCVSSDWASEYTGYLHAERWSHNPTAPVCIMQNPDQYGSNTNQDGGLLYATRFLRYEVGLDYGYSKEAVGDCSHCTSDKGPSFVHWGKPLCATGVTTVYSGFVMGPDYRHSGSVAEWLCMAPDPTESVEITTSNSEFAYVFEAQFLMDLGHFLPVREKTPACALCQDEVADAVDIETFHGTLTCPAGWNTVYRGYSMAGRGTHAPTFQICMDHTVELARTALGVTHSLDFDAFLYVGEFLNSDAYADETDVPCVVCARPPADGHCGNGIVEPPEVCDDGNYDETDSCAGCQVPRPDQFLNECLTDNATRSVLSAFSDADDDCVILGVSDAAVSVQGMLDAFLPGTTCESVCSPAPGASVCPGACASRPACGDEIYPASIWYSCPMPPSCAAGPPGETEKKTSMLLAIPRTGCALENPDTGLSTLLAVTFADEAAPFSGCATAADVEALGAGPPGWPARNCRGIGYHRGYSRTVDEMVRQGLPGKRCVASQSTVYGAIDVEPSAAGNVTRCDTEIADGDWWLCDKPTDLRAGDGREEAWLVVARAAADDSGCTASRALLVDVTVDDLAPVLEGLKRIEPPYVRAYVETTTLTGIAYAGWYFRLRTDSAFYDPIFASDMRADAINYLDIPEGMYVTLQHACCMIPTSSSFSIYYGPINGPFTAALDSSLGSAVADMFFVGVQPGYYADVWRSDFEVLAGVFDEAIRNEDGGSLSTLLASALDGEGRLEYANTYATCADLRDNVEWFFPEDGVAVVPESVHPRLYDGHRYTSELTQISPLTADVENFSVFASTNNRASSAVSPLGVRMKAYTSADYGGNEYEFDSNVYPFLWIMNGNTYSSARVAESPWCTNRPRRNACGVVASDKNLMIGEVVYDDRCRPPINETASVQRCTTAGAHDIAGCERAPAGSTVAAVVEAAVGEACATAGPNTTVSGDAPRATQWSEPCDGIAADRSVHDYYVCGHASGHEAVLVETPKGRCEAVAERRVWFAGSAPCAGGAKCGALSVGEAFAVSKNSTFVHWGQDSCPAGSSLVYSGMGAGTKTQDELGGSPKPLCLNSMAGRPTDIWSIYADQVVRSDFIEQNDDLALVYAMEYSFLSGQTAVSELLAVHGFEVPCAVCSVTQQTAWTQFGSDQCPGQQTTLVAGYTVATSWQQTRGEFMCMSQAPETIGNSDTSSDRNWNSIPVEVQVAGLFGNYATAQEANCAVCATPPGESGAVYVNYGEGSCRDGATTLVADGMIVGSHAQTAGGGTGYLCLVPDASSTNIDSVQRGTAVLPVHAEPVPEGPEALSDLGDFALSCSVCHASVASVHSTMVPGTSECPGGFDTAFAGYLVSQSSSEPTASDFVCLDAALERLGSVPLAGPAAPLYPVATVFGAGEQFGYVAGKPLACATCLGTAEAPSPTFVHWGADHRCPGGPADILYSGIAMGSKPGTGGAQLLCMPDTPHYYDADTAAPVGTLGGDLQPAWHYNEDSSIMANRDTVYHAMACTVCQPKATQQRVVSATEVVPGSTECPAGADLEYVGRMFSRASSSSVNGKTHFVCMTNRPDRPNIGVSSDYFADPLVLRESEFRGSVDDAYPDGHEVACAVCSWAQPKMCDGADLGGIYDEASCTFVGELTGQTLADLTSFAAGTADGCVWQGLEQTHVDTCPGTDGQTSCAEATLEAGRDAYLCEAPAACAQGRRSYHLVETLSRTCTAVQASVLSWQIAVPEVGLELPTCGALDLGGAVEGGSCRAIGRTEAGAVETVDEFLWRTTGTGCDEEGARIEGDSPACGALANNVTCSAAGFDGAYDWFECQVAAGADAACGSHVLVRTEVGTCDVVVSSAVTGRGGDARTAACNGTDFGGVLESASCAFVGQTSELGAEAVVAGCGLVGAAVGHTNVCPVDAVGSGATPCDNVGTVAPLDNYVCSYPASCALNNGGDDAVWVRAAPGTCDVTDMREVVPSQVSSYLWAHIELENGTATGTELTLRDSETDAVIAQTTVFEELTAGAITQVPLFQLAESAARGAELTMTAAGGVHAGAFVPGSVVLFGAPGYAPGGELVPTGECLGVAVAGTSAAVGAAVFAGNLTTSDDGYLGDLDGCGSGAASVYKHVFLWEAPESGVATITVSAAGFDPVVAVYEPTQCEQAACSDDFGGLSNDGVEVPAGAGSSYLVAVAGSSVGASGSFTVDIAVAALSLSGECGAPLVTDGNLVSRQGSALVSGVAAGSDTVFSSFGCSASAGPQRGWVWHAPASGTLTVTVSAVFDVAVEVRTGSTCVADACATGDMDSAAEVSVSVVAGEWYAIGITGNTLGQGGIFTLGIEFSAARRRRAGTVSIASFSNIAGRLGSDAFVVDLANASNATASCGASGVGLSLIMPFAGRFQISTEDSSVSAFVALVDPVSRAEYGCSVSAGGGPAILEATLEAQAGVLLVVGGAWGQSSGLVRINMMAVFDGAPGFVNTASAGIAQNADEVLLSEMELSLSRVLVRRSPDFGRSTFSTEALAGFAVTRASIPAGMFLFRSCRPIALAGGEAALFYSAVPTNATFFSDDLLMVRLEHDAASDAFPAQFSHIEVYPPAGTQSAVVFAPYAPLGDELGDADGAVSYVREGTSIYVTLRFASDPLPLGPVAGFLRLWIDDGGALCPAEALVPLQLLSGAISVRLRAVATRKFSRAAGLEAAFETAGGVLPLLAVVVEAWTGLESAFEFRAGAFSQPGRVAASSGFAFAVPMLAPGATVAVRGPGSQSEVLLVDGDGAVAAPAWVYPVFVVVDPNGAALADFISTDVLGAEHAFSAAPLSDSELFWSIRTDLHTETLVADVASGVADAVPVSVQIFRWQTESKAFAPFKHGLVLAAEVSEGREPEALTVLFEQDFAGVGAFGGGVQVWNRQSEQMQLLSVAMGDAMFVPSLSASDACLAFGSTVLTTEQSALFVPRDFEDVEVTVRLAGVQAVPTAPTLGIGVSSDSVGPSVARLLATSAALAARVCNNGGASIGVRTFVAPEAGLPPLYLTLAATGSAEGRLTALVDVLDSFGIERKYSFANTTASAAVTMLPGRNVTLGSDPTATEGALAVGVRPGYPNFPPLVEIVASGLTPSRPFLLAIGSRILETYGGCNSQVRQAAEVLNEACTDLTESIDIESYTVRMADAGGLWRGSANVTLAPRDAAGTAPVAIYVQIFDTDACDASQPFEGAFSRI